MYLSESTVLVQGHLVLINWIAYVFMTTKTKMSEKPKRCRELDFLINTVSQVPDKKMTNHAIKTPTRYRNFKLIENSSTQILGDHFFKG